MIRLEEFQRHLLAAWDWKGRREPPVRHRTSRLTVSWKGPRDQSAQGYPAEPVPEGRLDQLAEQVPEGRLGQLAERVPGGRLDLSAEQVPELQDPLVPEWLAELQLWFRWQPRLLWLLPTLFLQQTDRVSSGRRC